MNKNSTTQFPKRQKNVCQACGFEIGKHHTFESILAGSADFSQNGEYSAIRRTPIRSATFEADFLVPACQSLLTSVVASLPIVVASMWLRWSWYAPLAVSSVTILVAWYQSLEYHRSALLKTEEFSFFNSQGGDTLQGEGNAPGGIRMEIIEDKRDNAFRMKFSELPLSISVDDYVEVCKQILSGRGLTRRNFVDGAGVLSRSAFDEIVSLFYENDIMIKTGSGKKRLTEKGRLTLCDFLESVGESV